MFACTLLAKLNVRKKKVSIDFGDGTKTTRDITSLKPIRIDKIYNSSGVFTINAKINYPDLNLNVNPIVVGNNPLTYILKFLEELILFTHLASYYYEMSFKCFSSVVFLSSPLNCILKVVSMSSYYRVNVDFGDGQNQTHIMRDQTIFLTKEYHKIKNYTINTVLLENRTYTVRTNIAGFIISLELS